MEFKSRQKCTSRSSFKFTWQKSLRALAIILLVFSIVGCAKEPPTPVTKSRIMMGTVVDMRAYGRNAEKAMEKAFAKIQDIENKMSVNIAGSEVAQINDAAGVNAVKISAETLTVLRKAIEFAELTDGAFDPTIGPLVAAWGISTDHPRVPTEIEIDYLTSLIDWRKIEIQEENSEVFLSQPGMAIDLGAIAKGHAADEAAAVLRANGVKSAFVNLGGNVYVIGTKPDGSPWRIGIRDPFAPEATSFVGVISAADTSVVTSGTYERYFVKDGVLYHHILDPKTGYPAESDLASVTIVSPESIVADAVSTSVFLIGWEAGKELIEALPNVEGVLVDKNRSVWVSSGLRDKFEIAEGFVLDETR